jgi:multiple sugar transport system permease protein
MQSNMKRNQIIDRSVTYLVLSIGIIIAVFPIFYTLMASGKSNQDLLANAEAIIPTKFVFDNYIQAWNLANFKQYTLNSVHLAFFIVLGTIVTCTVAAYVFERGHFKGKEIVFGIVLSSMFVSLGALTLYPLLSVAKFFGINKSLWGVILIRVLGLNVANLFVARGYMATLPKELDEAAKIDGCTFLSTFTHIIFPLLKPLIATIGILEFRVAWNDYLMPLVFTMSNPDRMPLIVGVVNLKSTGEAAANWNVMLAGTAISIVPMILVFLFFNRYFIEGLTAGSVKG